MSHITTVATILHGSTKSNFIDFVFVVFSGDVKCMLTLLGSTHW